MLKGELGCEFAVDGAGEVDPCTTFSLVDPKPSQVVIHTDLSPVFVIRSSILFALWRCAAMTAVSKECGVMM